MTNCPKCNVPAVDDFCPTCHVDLSDPCPSCGQAGYHADGCAESEPAPADLTPIL